MSIGIIIRKNPERYAIIRTKSQAARAVVGHVDAKAVAVAKMMSIGENQAKQLIKKRSRGMVLDGKID